MNGPKLVDMSLLWEIGGNKKYRCFRYILEVMMMRDGFSDLTAGIIVGSGMQCFLTGNIFTGVFQFKARGQCLF